MKSATFTVLVGLLAVVTSLAASIAGIPGELGRWLGTAPPVKNKDAQVRELERRVGDLQTLIEKLDKQVEILAEQNTREVPRPVRGSVKGQMNETMLMEGIRSIKEEKVDGKRSRRHVQLDLVLEVDAGPDGNRARNKARLENQKPRIRSEIIRLLDEWSYADVRAPQFMRRFQLQVKKRINGLFGEHTVKNVFITNLER